jgi:hypothetical protein
MLFLLGRFSGAFGAFSGFNSQKNMHHIMTHA